MKNSGDGTTRAAQSTKPNQLATVSERKLNANRENAKKSTGPKTAVGKALSRMNAVKHGLFVRQDTCFSVQGEDPEEYQELLIALANQYQPVGRAEEIEVERIAICWWRLKRAWRYENAVNGRAQLDFGGWREEEEDWCKEQDQAAAAHILKLESVKKEIEDAGSMSKELKERIFAMAPEFELMWSTGEHLVQELLSEPTLRMEFLKLSRQKYPSMLALHTITRMISVLKTASNCRWTSMREIAMGQQAIPNREALDKISRYETTIERNLNRAIDRLERLQRRRKGDPVPPPVSVTLTP
jgi:hypothetical protein